MLKKIAPIILIIVIAFGGFLYSVQISHAAGSIIGGGLCAAGVLLGAISGGVDIYNCIWHWVVQPLIRKIANALENRLLNAMGSIITDKVNGGRDPYWITNWRNHILDSQARGNDVFRAVLADTELCPHFRDNLKRDFGAENSGGLIDNSGNLTFAPGSAPFQVSNRCTLSGDFSIDDFARDFSGGWGAWLELVQPQNNYYGAYSVSTLEKNKQIALENQASQDQSIAQSGWKGAKQDGDSSSITRASGCAKKNADGRCTFLGKTLTPGTILNQAAEQIVTRQKPNEILHAQTLEDLILAIEDAIIEKVSGQMKNLLDGEDYVEREYQSNIDSARRAGGGGTDAQNQARLACENQCQNQGYPTCSPAPSATPDPAQVDLCLRTALSRCLLACQ